MGITNRPELQGPLFVVFFFNYMAIALGNLGLIILTTFDSHLQTPMYYFIRHLAFVDLGYSTAVGPKMLVSFIEKKNIISYYGCAIQLFFIVIFLTSEFFNLSAMAVDRYVAICKPLLYMVIMSDRVCWISVVISYVYIVVVFYGTLLFMYLQPHSSHSFDTDKMASVFYTLVIPMLNPLIYSLRNKEVKDALKRLIKKLMQTLSFMTNVK
uniref:G-protein coupled receptors family 1 profile domain-containing protein n=1 Tax=Monodelphis domestica TaxID=13616 RepID=F6UJB4_MONDO